MIICEERKPLQCKQILAKFFALFLHCDLQTELKFGHSFVWVGWHQSLLCLLICANFTCEHLTTLPTYIVLLLLLLLLYIVFYFDFVLVVAVILDILLGVLLIDRMFSPQCPHLCRRNASPPLQSSPTFAVWPWRVRQTPTEIRAPRRSQWRRTPAQHNPTRLPDSNAERCSRFGVCAT